MSLASSFDHSVLLSNSSVSTEARRIAQVRTIFDRPQTAEETLQDVRPLVERLVRGEEYVTGSKMLAYENVGRAIGKSASWVRKLVGRQGGVGLQGFALLNIVHFYDGLCARIEAAAAAERLRAEQLREKANAHVARAAGLVEGPEGPDRGPAGELP